MSNPLTQAILAATTTQPLRMVPCQVTQVSPLLVQLNTGGIVTGMRVIGGTYSVGAQAVALWSPPNPPVIVLIGA